jgi:twitching motility protein PilT
VLASELMINNGAVANLIREGKVQNIYSVMETHAREGMHTLDKSLKQLYLGGEISREEARRRMKNPGLLDTGG